MRKQQYLSVAKQMIFALIICLLCATMATAQTDGNIVLVIDPGHGGKDPGNQHTGAGMKDEKDINLAIAMKTGRYIDSLLSNVTVIYTRTTDVYLSPDERAELANSRKADYFLCIHCNHSVHSNITGIEIHVHTDRCKESIKFAEKLNYELSERAHRPSRGIKNFDDRNNSNILVVRDTQMPAVLVECGFMSNADEEKYLNDDYGQTLIASALYRAFRDFSGATKRSDCTPQYRVQIKASVSKIDKNSTEFRGLGMGVVEVVGDASATFRYKYFVGNCCTLAEANKLKARVRRKGFKDAFVVPIK